MQELSKAIAAGVDAIGSSSIDSAEFAGNPEAEELQRVAAEWAKMSILTFDGELRDKALEISKAVASFTMELMTPGSSSH